MAGTCDRRRSLSPRRGHIITSPLYSIRVAFRCDRIEALVAALVTV
eukprot:COSAG01_NODE_54623_length_331_cov_0.125000_1_plen_45_part_10